MQRAAIRGRFAAADWPGAIGKSLGTPLAPRTEFGVSERALRTARLHASLINPKPIRALRFVVGDSLGHRPRISPSPCPVVI